MNLLIACWLVPLLSGLISLVLGFLPAVARWSAAMGTAVGGLLGLTLALRQIHRGESIVWEMAWNLPIGSFQLGLDALSSFFLIVISIVLLACAVYSAAYLKHDDGHRPQGTVGLFFSLLAAGMMLVVLARDALLFLIVWEVMSVSAFFLVMYEDEHIPARHAGWTYLVATHLGAAFLLLLFIS
ncbi:MAG TPA: oxidoreductase, partial [Candidatus Ozemobacteraceae bacterium]|nr:oxidoreductase [Candidatus Ozemobacteraceae bacterium]